MTFINQINVMSYPLFLKQSNSSVWIPFPTQFAYKNVVGGRQKSNIAYMSVVFYIP